jgi:hypothetical protein
MKKLFLIILIMCVAMVIYPMDQKKLEELKKEAFNNYFKPCEYKEVFIKDYLVEFPMIDNSKIKYKSMYITGQRHFLEIGVFIDFEAEIHKGFRLYDYVYLFKYEDWLKIIDGNNYSDIPCYRYVITTQTRYNNKEKRFDYLASDSFIYWVEKTNGSIKIYSPEGEAGQNKKYFFTIKL